MSMPQHILLADPTADALTPRVEGLENFAGQITQAVDTLVDTLLRIDNQDIASLGERMDLSEKRGTLLSDAVKSLMTHIQVEGIQRNLEKASRMYPKTRTVVFAGRRHWGDNIKYAWQECHARAAELGLECWLLPFDEAQERLVRGLGGNCFPVSHEDWTPEDVRRALGVAVLVIADHFFHSNPFVDAMFAGARRIQMWHGISIKELGFRNANYMHLEPWHARMLASCGPFDRFLGTTARNEAEWRQWFAFDRYVASGYPRNDVLVRQPQGLDLAGVDEVVLARAQDFRARGRQVFLYAPTFRDADKGRWILAAGLERLAAAIDAAGHCLIVNMHPVEHPWIPELSSALPTVSFVSPQTDVYPILGQATALITDYSSVMFDYMLLGRPIVLYRPDHDDYVGRSRKLHDDKLSDPPGPLVERCEDLIDLLRDPAALDRPQDRAAREAFVATYHDHRDGDSAARFMDVIQEELEAALQPRQGARRA